MDMINAGYDIAKLPSRSSSQDSSVNYNIMNTKFVKAWFAVGSPCDQLVVRLFIDKLMSGEDSKPSGAIYDARAKDIVDGLFYIFLPF